MQSLQSNTCEADKRVSCSLLSMNISECDQREKTMHYRFTDDLSLNFSQIKSDWISSLNGCVVIVRQVMGPDMLHM